MQKIIQKKKTWDCEVVPPSVKPKCPDWSAGSTPVSSTTDNNTPDFPRGTVFTWTGWTLLVLAGLAAAAGLVYGLCLLVAFLFPIVLQFILCYIIGLICVALLVHCAFRGTNETAFAADFILAFIIALFLMANGCCRIS